MALDIYYRQCEVVRKDENGATLCRVCWLPEKFAQLCSVLRLRLDGRWSENWHVAWVGDDRKLESQLPDWRKLIRQHRKSTGDALPPVDATIEGCF